MTCVFSGLGVLAWVTGHVGERSSRLGPTGPLEGAAARHFGLSIFVFGLLPLVLLARSRGGAMRFAASVVVSGLLSVFLGGFVFR